LTRCVKKGPGPAVMTVASGAVVRWQRLPTSNRSKQNRGSIALVGNFQTIDK
jgi:hypothetical protein